MNSDILYISVGSIYIILFFIYIQIPNNKLLYFISAITVTLIILYMTIGKKPITIHKMSDNVVTMPTSTAHTHPPIETKAPKILATLDPSQHTDPTLPSESIDVLSTPSVTEIPTNECAYYQDKVWDNDLNNYVCRDEFIKYNKNKPDQYIVGTQDPPVYIPHIYMLNSYPILKLWTGNKLGKKNVASFVYDRTRGASLYSQLGIGELRNNLPLFNGYQAATYFDDNEDELSEIFMKKFIISDTNDIYTLRTKCHNMCGQIDLSKKSSSWDVYGDTVPKDENAKNICDPIIEKVSQDCNPRPDFSTQNTLPPKDSTNKYRPAESGTLYINGDIFSENVIDFEIYKDEVFVVTKGEDEDSKTYLNFPGTDCCGETKCDGCITLDDNFVSFNVLEKYIFVFYEDKLIQKYSRTSPTDKPVDMNHIQQWEQSFREEDKNILPAHCPTSNETQPSAGDNKNNYLGCLRYDQATNISTIDPHSDLFSNMSCTLTEEKIEGANVFVNINHLPQGQAGCDPPRFYGRPNKLYINKTRYWKGDAINTAWSDSNPQDLTTPSPYLVINKWGNEDLDKRLPNDQNKWDAWNYYANEEHGWAENCDYNDASKRVNINPTYRRHFLFENQNENYIDCKKEPVKITCVRVYHKVDDLYIIFASYDNGAIWRCTTDGVMVGEIVLEESPTIDDTTLLREGQAPIGGVSSFQVVPNEADFSKFTLYVMQRKYIKESVNIIKPIYKQTSADVDPNSYDMFNSDIIKKRGGTIENNGGGDLYIYYYEEASQFSALRIGILYHIDLGGMMNTNVMEDLHFDTFLNHSTSFQVMPHKIDKNDYNDIALDNITKCYYNKFTDKINIDKGDVEGDIVDDECIINLSKGMDEKKMIQFDMSKNKLTSDQYVRLNDEDVNMNYPCNLTAPGYVLPYQDHGNTWKNSALPMTSEVNTPNNFAWSSWLAQESINGSKTDIPTTQRAIDFITNSNNDANIDAWFKKPNNSWGWGSLWGAEPTPNVVKTSNDISEFCSYPQGAYYTGNNLGQPGLTQFDSNSEYFPQNNFPLNYLTQLQDSWTNTYADQFIPDTGWDIYDENGKLQDALKTSVLQYPNLDEDATKNPPESSKYYKGPKFKAGHVQSKYWHLRENINNFINNFPVDGSLGYGTAFPYKSKFSIPLENTNAFQNIDLSKKGYVADFDNGEVNVLHSIQESNIVNHKYMCSNLAPDVYLDPTESYPDNLQHENTQKFCNIHPDFDENSVASYKQMGTTYINHFDDRSGTDFVLSSWSSPTHMKYGLEPCKYTVGHDDGSAKDFLITNNWGSYCRTGFNQKIGCNPDNNIQKVDKKSAYMCDKINSNVIEHTLDWSQSTTTKPPDPQKNKQIDISTNAHSSCPAIKDNMDDIILSSSSNKAEPLYEDNNPGSWFNQECPSTHPYKRAINGKIDEHGRYGTRGITRKYPQNNQPEYTFFIMSKENKDTGLISHFIYITDEPPDQLDDIPDVITDKEVPEKWRTGKYLTGFDNVDIPTIDNDKHIFYQVYDVDTHPNPFNTYGDCLEDVNQFLPADEPQHNLNVRQKCSENWNNPYEYLRNTNLADTNESINGLNSIEECVGSCIENKTCTGVVWAPTGPSKTMQCLRNYDDVPKTQSNEQGVTAVLVNDKKTLNTTLIKNILGILNNVLTKLGDKGITQNSILIPKRINSTFQSEVDVDISAWKQMYTVSGKDAHKIWKSLDIFGSNSITDLLTLPYDQPKKAATTSNSLLLEEPIRYGCFKYNAYKDMIDIPKIRDDMIKKDDLPVIQENFRPLDSANTEWGDVIFPNGDKQNTYFDQVRKLCQQCQNDNDCESGLFCWQAQKNDQIVPGCYGPVTVQGGTKFPKSYCVDEKYRNNSSTMFNSGVFMQTNRQMLNDSTIKRSATYQKDAPHSKEWNRSFTNDDKSINYTKQQQTFIETTANTNYRNELEESNCAPYQDGHFTGMRIHTDVVMNNLMHGFDIEKNMLPYQYDTKIGGRLDNPTPAPAKHIVGVRQDCIIPTNAIDPDEWECPGTNKYEYKVFNASDQNPQAMKAYMNQYTQDLYGSSYSLITDQKDEPGVRWANFDKVSWCDSKRCEQNQMFTDLQHPQPKALVGAHMDVYDIRWNSPACGMDFNTICDAGNGENLPDQNLNWCANGGGNDGWKDGQWCSQPYQPSSCASTKYNVNIDPRRLHNPVGLVWKDNKLMNFTNTASAGNRADLSWGYGIVNNKPIMGTIKYHENSVKLSGNNYQNPILIWDNWVGSKNVQGIGSSANVQIYNTYAKDIPDDLNSSVVQNKQMSLPGQAAWSTVSPGASLDQLI